MGVPMYLKGRLKCASFFSTCATLSARAPRGQTLGSVRFLQWLLATSQPEGEGDGENDTRTTFEGMKQKATEGWASATRQQHNTCPTLPCEYVAVPNTVSTDSETTPCTSSWLNVFCGGRVRKGRAIAARSAAHRRRPPFAGSDIAKRRRRILSSVHNSICCDII